MSLSRSCFFLQIFIVSSLSFNTSKSQELGHFNKSVTVDFVKNKIWAEIISGETGSADRETIQSTGTTIATTSDPVIGANEKDQKAQTAGRVVEVGRVKEAGDQSAGGRADGDESSGKTTRKRNILAEIIPRSEDNGGNTPPYITDPRFVQRQVVPIRAYKAFHCKAKGDPAPIYTWYKDNQRLDASGKLVQAYQNGTLVFAQYSFIEDGMYHCTAVNKFGTDVSIKFEIRQEVRPFEADKSDPFEVRAKKWEKYNMPCGKTPETIPEYYKRWYGIESKQYNMNNRLGTDSMGNLHFAYTTKEDSGLYKCGLAHSASIVFFNKRNFFVEEASDTGDFSPSPEFVTPNPKALLGKEFVLECFFSGKPVPQITWKNSSNHEIKFEDKLYEIYDFDRKLKIRTVRQEDEGTFKCSAVNSVATDEVSIYVNVTTPPLRPERGGLSTHVIPDKEDFTLTCKAKAATGERLEPPVWYRNGERLTRNNLPDLDRYSFSEDFTELHIKKLVKTVDMASYQCSVNNSEGQLYMTGYIRVITALEIMRRPNDTIKIVSNSSSPYDISVRATGDNCCMISIHYYYNNTQLSESKLSTPPFSKNFSNGQLTFDPTSMSREALQDWMGDYECRVSTKYQTKTIRFTLTSGDTAPQPQLAKEASAGLWWIYILCGVVVILIVIVIIIIVYKSNYPGETYQLEKTELKHHLNPEEDLLNQSFQEI